MQPPMFKKQHPRRNKAYIETVLAGSSQLSLASKLCRARYAALTALCRAQYDQMR
jgi:hypothetical protein